MKTRIGIVGYGNIGKGVENSILKNQELFGDVCLNGIITRRPQKLKSINGMKTYDANSLRELEKFAENVDIAILCGGSAIDLPKQSPLFTTYLSTVDSFDTHADVPKYFQMIDRVAKYHDNVSIIASGWDPGTFSLERVLADAFLPGSNPVGFYGLSEKGGLSMGHSDAIRKIEGVLDARQYTHAIPQAIEKAKKGEKLEIGEMHTRECFVVINENADKDLIRDKITNMPKYFKPFQTTVNFVTQEELNMNHSFQPHDGMVVATAMTNNDNRSVIEYRNQWESNPEGTGNILVASARAAHRLKKEGKNGAFTLVDIPPAYFSPRDKNYILEKFI